MLNQNFVHNPKIFLLLCAAFACAVSTMFLGCSSDSDFSGGSAEETGIVAIVNKDIAGVSQKGPFVTGSAVTVQELDGVTLAQTGKSFKGKISSDKGDFSVTNISLASQYALLEATGYYRNEITGEKSSGVITLNAITDLSIRETVNINLLTHLEYERVMYLVLQKKMSIAKAKQQAEKEILATFNIDGEFGNSEDLNIFEQGDGNAALLAISVLLQGGVDVAGLSERMGNFSMDIAENGTWNDDEVKTAIADWACDVDLRDYLPTIRNNIASWKFTDSVPEFEKFVTGFWWESYGLGKCTESRKQEHHRNENKLSNSYNEYFVCDGSRWLLQSADSTESDSLLSSSSAIGTSSGMDKSSSSSSASRSSSSSIYNPFASSSSGEVIPELPSDLSFLDDFIVAYTGYTAYGGGKQEIWFGKRGSGLDPPDSIASVLVNELGENGFDFAGAVLNDSNLRSYDPYNDTSYVYSKHLNGKTYKVAMTTWLDGGAMLCYQGLDLKIVVLEDGFDEVPSADFSSLQYEKLPQDLNFILEYTTTLTRQYASDDSLMTRRFGRHKSNQGEEEKDLALFEDSLVAHGFVFSHEDTVTYYYVENEYSSNSSGSMDDSLVYRRFYTMETPLASYELKVYLIEGSEMTAMLQQETTYGYSLYITTRYKE